jgi:hypothetical protein
MTYSSDVVARVRAAVACGLSTRTIHELTGIPMRTIGLWREYTSRKHSKIQPDPEVMAIIRMAIKGQLRLPDLQKE